MSEQRASGGPTQIWFVLIAPLSVCGGVSVARPTVAGRSATGFGGAAELAGAPASTGPAAGPGAAGPGPGGSPGSPAGGGTAPPRRPIRPLGAPVTALNHTVPSAAAARPSGYRSGPVLCTVAVGAALGLIWTSAFAVPF